MIHVQMTIMKVIHMAGMLDGLVPAVGRVLMIMFAMNDFMRPSRRSNAKSENENQTSVAHVSPHSSARASHACC